MKSGFITVILGAVIFGAAHCYGQALAQGTEVCDSAARDAEAEFGLPSGMLLAIGRVESGGWPWTANFDGAGETYRGKAEAIEALTRARSPQPSDVDVGCFQISLRFHPNAFTSMAEALDPAANAHYAARFLHELHDRLGDWHRAVGAYHSSTAVLEADYRERVFANWKTPHAVVETEAPRWRVISISGSLAAIPSGRGLPAVITLGN